MTKDPRNDVEGEGKIHPDKKKMELNAKEAQDKMQAEQAVAQAREAEQTAQQAQEKAEEAKHQQRVAEGEAEADKPAKEGKAETAKSADEGAKKAVSEEDAEEVEAVESPYQVKAKPELDEATAAALRLRAQKKARQPAFRRQEWWRYKDLGGKDAPWRRPRGMHSKMRRHYKYRPPVVSVGYRGPAAVRGLHPSGFVEVLVHRPEDLEPVDPKTQAVRIGGTVGGRKAEAITKAADERGIRVLNRRD